MWCISCLNALVGVWPCELECKSKVEYGAVKANAVVCSSPAAPAFPVSVLTCAAWSPQCLRPELLAFLLDMCVHFQLYMCVQSSRTEAKRRMSRALARADHRAHG